MTRITCLPYLLKELGYKPGYFYEVMKITDNVSSYLEFKVYPIFKMKDQIPTFYYFAFALDDLWDTTDDPTTCLLTRDMFLLPYLEV